MCRWGVSYSKWHFYVFDAKKCSCDPPNKKFSCFCTGSHQTIFRLSPERIFDLLTHLRPFQIRLEMKTKVQNWTKMSICHKTVNHKKIWNVHLDALICPLQIINWHWTPIIDPSWSKRMLYPPPHPMSKITRSAISRKPIDQNKKKIDLWRIYFYTFILVLGWKFKIQMAENLRWTFWTCVKSTLNGPANGPEETYSKIQNRLRRAP